MVHLIKGPLIRLRHEALSTDDTAHNIIDNNVSSSIARIYDTVTLSREREKDSVSMIPNVCIVS